MNHRHLLYLRLVVEHGSLAAAARAAGVSPSAISQGLSQLQAQCVPALFERQGRRLLPTDFARHLAAETARHHSAVEGSLQSPHAPAPVAEAGLLRVGLMPSAALVCGPTLVQAWCPGAVDGPAAPHLPNRRLILQTGHEGQLLADLTRGLLDLVVAPRPRGFHHPGVKGEALYTLQPRVYGRRGHPLAQAGSLRALAGAQWAAVLPAVSGPVNMLAEAFAVRHLPPPPITVGCADHASLVRLLARSDLLAVLPDPVLTQGPESDADGALQPLVLQESLPLYDMWVFWPTPARAGGPGRTLQRVVAALRTGTECPAPSR